LLCFTMRGKICTVNDLQAKKITRLGILLGMVMVLSALEHLFVTPFMPPHVKLGLANIIIMYCVFAEGHRSAFLLTLAKSLFVLVTRGAVAGLLSFCGGMLAVLIIVLLARTGKKPLGVCIISICGALGHNTGQIGAAMVLLSTPWLVYYLPLLIIASIVTGALTGALTSALMEVKILKP